MERCCKYGGEHSGSGDLAIMRYYYYSSMLSGSIVTKAWRVLWLRIEETASRYGR
jgi:hypothetical protein